MTGATTQASTPIGRTAAAQMAAIAQRLYYVIVTASARGERPETGTAAGCWLMVVMTISAFI